MERGSLWLWLLFLGVTAAVVFPWFVEPGFLFLLDFVWTPVHPWPTETLREGLITSVPHEAVFALLAHVLPSPLVQKLAFSLPFLLSGVSLAHLVRWLCRHSPGRATDLAALTAGLFYALNPFVVTRVFMGQYYLLLAYALTPWAVLAAFRFLDRPTRRTALGAGLWAVSVILTNAHHVVFVPLILLPLIVRRRTPALPWRMSAWALAPLVIIGLVGGIVAAQGTHSVALNALGPHARALQAPETGNLLVDAFTLTATWKTDLPFVFPHELLPQFGVSMAGLFMVMGLGAWWMWREPTGGPIVRRLLLVAAVSAVVAIGVAHPLTEPLAAFLYRHVPFALALRDSAKFLSLVALTESVLLGLGVVALGRIAATNGRLRSVRLAVQIVILLITLYLTSPAIAGFSGQIAVREYPKSWAEWNERLAQEDKVRMLFLPWHQYLPFSFTDDRTVVNPAGRYFTAADVISGDNSEVGGTSGRPFVPSESLRPLSRRIEDALAKARNGAPLSPALRTESIRFVALAMDTLDADEHRFLFDDPGLRVVFEQPELTVWEVTEPRPQK